MLAYARLLLALLLGKRLAIWPSETRLQSQRGCKAMCSIIFWLSGVASCPWRRHDEVNELMKGFLAR